MNKPKRHLSNQKREWLTGYLFIGLWVIGVLVFTMWPMLQAFYYSLSEATFKGNKIVSEFLWFDNFRYAFTVDAKFPTMVREYLMGIIFQVPFALTFSLLISLVLNQKIKLRPVWRLIYFLPVIIISGPVVVELMTQGTTSIDLEHMAAGRIIVGALPTFLSNIIFSLFDKLIIVLWYTGIPILIFLAGLQRINKQIYEAASIDGASAWQTFWKITLPSMTPFILVNAVYMIVTLSNSSLMQGSDATSKTIIQYIQEQYVTTTGKGYGYACCLGIIYLLLILLQIGFYALVLLPKNRVKKIKGVRKPNLKKYERKQKQFIIKSEKLKRKEEKRRTKGGNQ